MSFIDVHCHLTGGEYGDLDALITRIQSAGVKKVITAGFDAPSSIKGKELAEKYDCVYFTAGLHPTELKKCSKGDLDIIEGLLSHKKCVALGEIGLDYHYEDTDEELQKTYFAAQLEIAHAHGLPVQIHSRDCAGDMHDFLLENRDKLSHGALLHCYSHSAELALELQKLGLYFSFGGTSTYSGSKRAAKCIRALDYKRLLTETDSPYLAPKSRQGEFPNTPESIPEILQNMATLRGEDCSALENTVWQNAHNLFFKLA